MAKPSFKESEVYSNHYKARTQVWRYDTVTVQWNIKTKKINLQSSVLLFLLLWEPRSFFLIKKKKPINSIFFWLIMKDDEEPS